MLAGNALDNKSNGVKCSATHTRPRRSSFCKNFFFQGLLPHLNPIIPLSRPVGSANPHHLTTSQENDNNIIMGQAIRAMKYDRTANECNAIPGLTFHGRQLQWHRLDDGVMGGKSETVHSCSTSDDLKCRTDQYRRWRIL